MDTYQDESETIQKYKKLSDFKGQYNLNFIDQIQVHQMKTKCLFADAIHLLSSEKKMTIVSTGSSRFLPNWDLGLYDQINHLDSVIFGGIFLGAFDESRAAYTGVKSFNGHGPLISLRPIWKPGNLNVVWPSYPLLIKTSILKKLQSCSIYESQLELAMSVYTFWTSKKPVALTKEIEALNLSLPSNFYEKHKLLGLEKDANALEIISKFGSISSYQWSLSE